MEGFVYILSNESLPGIYKVGYTSKSVAERIAELSRSTSIPTPFKEEASYFVFDIMSAEREMHETLKDYRISDNKEFFKADLSDIKKAAGLLYKDYRKTTSKIYNAVWSTGIEYYKQEYKNFLNRIKNGLIKRKFAFDKYSDIYIKNGYFYKAECYTRVCSVKEYNEWANDVLQNDMLMECNNTYIRILKHSKKYIRKAVEYRNNKVLEGK